MLPHCGRPANNVGMKPTLTVAVSVRLANDPTLLVHLVSLGLGKLAQDCVSGAQSAVHESYLLLAVAGAGVSVARVSSVYLT